MCDTSSWKLHLGLQHFTTCILLTHVHSNMSWRYCFQQMLTSDSVQVTIYTLHLPRQNAIASRDSVSYADATLLMCFVYAGHTVLQLCPASHQSRRLSHTAVQLTVRPSSN
jgi:hypothetical protein